MPTTAPEPESRSGSIPLPLRSASIPSRSSTRRLIMNGCSDDGEGFSLLSPFGADSDYFAPSEQPFMINLRVDDLDGMLADLQAKGIAPLGRQDEDYGRFAWILDCDGIKVELWQQLGPAPAA